MQFLINKAVKDLLNPMKDKHREYPICQVVLSENSGLTFGRYNVDGSFEQLPEGEPGYIEYPVVIRLIDAQGESKKAVVTKKGYEFSEN